MAEYPNKWVAPVLGALIPPVGLLYVGAPWFAAASVIVTLVFALAFAGSDAIMPDLIVMLAGGWLAWYLASRRNPEAARPWYSRWYSLLGFVVVSVALVGLVRAGFLAEVFGGRH